MTVILTQDLLEKIYPAMSNEQAKAFVDKQAVMADILETPERAALCFANMFAETSGFALSGLTENIHYSADRMSHVWQNRFHGSASEVIAKYGNDAGWQNRAFDDIYGNRMGNRPGSHDGSAFIGRGGPQVTGADGYEAVGKRIGVDLKANPMLCASVSLQPEITAAFWDWKSFNKFADRTPVDVSGCRRVWNGGTNGLDVVQKQFPRILSIVKVKPATAAAVVKAPTSLIDPNLKGDQLHLIDLGYHEIGDADGRIGGKTLGAIKAFFTDRGIDAPATYPSAALDAGLSRAIQEDWHRPIAPGRAYATEDQLAPKVQSIAPAQRASLFSRVAGWFSGAGATGGAILQFLPQSNETVQTYKEIITGYFSDIPGWFWFAVVCVVAMVTAQQIAKSKQATVADYQRGKIN